MRALFRTPALVGALAFAGILASPSHAMTDAELAATVGQRLHGDRSGACMAVAVVDETVSRAFVCADARKRPRIGPDSAFEIGSISKTMTAVLLADLIIQGKASLDDPLADYLPDDARVPSYEGQPILLRHIVTHTSGLPALPPGVAITDPADPYASMTPREVIAALAKVELSDAPGTVPAYSNFAMMLLSYGIAQRAGTDLETLLDERLFTPLQMDGAYIAKRPARVREATGHLPTGKRTAAWHMHTDMAGVGGVRATLDDMVRYVQAQLRTDNDSRVAEAIRLTHTQPDVPNALAKAVTWFIAPVNGQPVYVHEGGTGGFSALVAFDTERRRGVVVLADTALTSLGGLSDVGVHLLDDAVPLGQPRTVATPSADLLDALVGDYSLDGGMRMALTRKKDVLYIQAAGQPAFKMGYDSAGDFYPLQFDALLRPQESADGSTGFTWHQGGGVMSAARAEATLPAATVQLDAAQLDEYAGRYPLMPGFELAVSVKKGQLHARATGQGAFPLDALGDDRFEAAAYGIRINFERGSDGQVRSLKLLQGGATMQGDKR